MDELDEYLARNPHVKLTKAKYQLAQINLRFRALDRAEEQQRKSHAMDAVPMPKGPMSAEEDAATRFQILDALDNNPNFIKAAPGVFRFQFVQDAVAAKRSGQIARLADFVAAKK